MKKSILAVAGVAAFAGVAIPFAGVYAADGTMTQRDSITVTIDSNCTLRNITHTAGTGSAATSWTSDALTGSMLNGTLAENYGATTMGVTCNDSAGSHVSVALTDLTADTKTGDVNNKIPANTSLSASTSGWAIKSSAITPSAWQITGDVWTKSTPADSTEPTFTVTYGVGVSTTQQKGTYTGTATYTLAHPAGA